MVSITPKLEVSIKVIIIIFLLILNIVVYLNGKDLDCGKCVLMIKEHVPGTKDFIQNISINELYNEVTGECKRWIG